MMQLKVVSVPVSDQDRARAFYRDVLGFRVVIERPFGPTRTWIQMMPPSGAMSIALATWFETMPPGSMRGLILETLDIDVQVEKLAAKGLVVSEIRSVDWGRYASFSDPDGNGWVIYTPVVNL